MGQERLILVHGTGASQPGPAGDEKWWQPESPFARELLDQLSVGHAELGGPRPDYQFESFKWSGANSESERRKGGRRLAARLADLERDHVQYHLIGHSHGGSVIWHALGAMNGIRPRMLKSWITVGTPFLKFGDRGLAYFFVFLAMAIATSACVYLLLGSVLGVYVDEYARVFRDAPLLASIGSIVGLLAAIGLAVYSVAGLVTQVWKRFIFKARKVSRWQIAYFGRRWLPIMHLDDEPLNGLRASVVQPPEPFVARFRSVFEKRDATSETGPSETGSGGRAAGLAELPANAVRVLFETLVAPVYNATIAPLVDQFLWETIKRVLQGNDVPGEFMLDCDRVPFELDRYWADTPDEMQKALSTMADAAAVSTAAAVRRHLLEMAQGTGRLSGMARALSWKEVIHTSYFDSGTGLASLVAEFVRAKTAGPTRKPISTATAAKPASKRRGAQRGKPYHPLLLHGALGLLVAGLCAFATVSTFAIEQAWLRPTTNSFQMGNAADEVALSENASLRILPRLDDILMRMVLLDQTDKATAIAMRLEDGIRYMGENARLERLQNIAFAIGLKGSEPELAQLLGEVSCESDAESSCLEGMSRDQVSAFLLVHVAAAGHLAGNILEKVAGDQLKALLPTADPDNWVRGHLVDVLLSASAFQLADAVGGTDESACEGVRHWADSVVTEVDYRGLPDRLSECLTEKVEAYRDQTFNTYENYFSPGARTLADIVKHLPQEQTTYCRAPIALAAAAMDRCLADRDMMLPSGDREEPKFSAEKSPEEMLTEIRFMSGRFGGGDLPACSYSLDQRLSDLIMCLREPEAIKPSGPTLDTGTGDASATEVELPPDNLSWASTFWNDAIGTAGTQDDICRQDEMLPYQEPGRTMQELAGNLANLRPQDEASLRDSIGRRTEHELGRLSAPNEILRDDILRCGWAALGMAWLRLGEPGRAVHLFDLILTDENAAQGGAMLDFHLSVADSASAYSPGQAKRFLDRSFELVDQADASLFFQTSDGSADDFFVYGKTDISRLYAKIGEYRLAILASDRLDRLDDGKVAAYLNMLDAEIKQMGRYDDRTLDALKPEHRLPVYRVY